VAGTAIANGPDVSGVAELQLVIQRERVASAEPVTVEERRHAHCRGLRSIDLLVAHAAGIGVGHAGLVGPPCVRVAAHASQLLLAHVLGVAECEARAGLARKDAARRAQEQCRAREQGRSPGQKRHVTPSRTVS
jgi:hypothetical protein